jgi:hypothetical protein
VARYPGHAASKNNPRADSTLTVMPADQSGAEEQGAICPAGFVILIA